MKAHFGNLKVINYHSADNCVHANFYNDLQKALEKETEIEDNEELSQMLTQRQSLLSQTRRILGTQIGLRDITN